MQPSPNTLCSFRQFINNSKKYNNRLYECTVTVSWVRQKPARREEALKTCQLCNKWGTIVCVLSWNYIIVCRWCSEVHGSWNFPEAQKTCEPFYVEKKPLKLAVKCFPKTGEKQMRDLKAKPAVSTLKSVHTNYFPEGVSTLFPLCCQRRHSLGCRRALSLPLPGNAQQHPISILICSQSIITPLSSI